MKIAPLSRQIIGMEWYSLEAFCRRREEQLFGKRNRTDNTGCTDTEGDASHHREALQ